jgi:uncharacterized damage-inducible protein DinB
MEKEFIENLIKLFERDLNTLEREIGLFTSEDDIWKIDGEIKNPAGNLALHLCGNLQHYIGKILGGSDYNRNRNNEFAAKNIPQSQLISEINKTKVHLIQTLKNLDTKSLQTEYPEMVFDHSMTVMYFIMHLHAHLNYHLGQINYHRRLVAARTSHIK